MTDITKTPVSLVTAVFNQDQFVAQTIDSVLAQDYPNLEYLVIDDGSTDATHSIIMQYADRCTCLRHDNVGQAQTLNRGWSISRGAYLGYLSGDDILSPDAISLLAKALDENPDVVVVYGDFDLIDSSGKKIQHVRSNDFSLAEMTEHLVCHPGVGALFRRSVFDTTGGWNPNLRKIPDFEFWLRASKYGPLLRVPRNIGAYRVHQDSTSIRPIPGERSNEIVVAMHDYWKGRGSTPEARRGLSCAYHMAARSHAQSGRILTSLHQLAIAIKYRPRLLISFSSWKKYLGSHLLRFVSRFGWLSGHLR